VTTTSPDPSDPQEPSDPDPDDPPDIPVRFRRHRGRGKPSAAPVA
jgi:hypothetical protein